MIIKKRVALLFVINLDYNCKLAFTGILLLVIKLHSLSLSLPISHLFLNNNLKYFVKFYLYIFFN